VTTTAISITGSFTTQYLLTTSASPAAAGSVSPASGYYDANAVVPVTATANPGYTFASWSGACSGSGACSVSMTGPMTVTANFNVSITISVPPGITFTFAGTTYTGPQTFSVAPVGYTLSTTSPQATATGTQAVFVSWSDGGAISHLAAITVPITITGTFKTQYLLTTAAAPAADGSVSPVTSYYDSGVAVGVTATANAGFAFAGWSGDCVGAGACSVTMSMPKSVTANFNPTVTITVPAGVGYTFAGVPRVGTGSPTVIPVAPNAAYSLSTTSPQAVAAGTQVVWVSWSDGGAQTHDVSVGTSPVSIIGTFKTQYLLTTSASPAADGTVSPASGYVDAGIVTVTETANAGFIFANWSGGTCSGSAGCSFLMNGPKTVTANFTLAVVSVTVNVPAGVQFSLNGVVHTGTTTVNLPPGSYPLSTPSPQSTGPLSQLRFVSWSDGGAQSHSLIVAGPTSVTGAYQVQYLLTALASPGNEGTVTPFTPGPWYDAGTVVLIQEAPNPGFEFDFWGGDCSGSSTVCVVIMSAPHQVIAHFGVQQNWVQMFPPTPGPSPRTHAAMASDAADQCVVLFGGVQGDFTNFNPGTVWGDTWLWDGSKWMKMNPTNSPPARWGAMMTYDAAHGQVVLFGGRPDFNLNGSFGLADTWVLDIPHNTWILKSTSGPARFLGSMAYDPQSGRPLLFGGLSTNITLTTLGPGLERLGLDSVIAVRFEPTRQWLTTRSGSVSCCTEEELKLRKAVKSMGATKSLSGTVRVGFNSNR